MSYNDNSEYGGGGRGSDNYYNQGGQGQDEDGRNQSGYGRERNDGYGGDRRQQNQQESGSYGRSNDGYGSGNQSSYGDGNRVDSQGRQDNPYGYSSGNQGYSSTNQGSNNDNRNERRHDQNQGYGYHSGNDFSGALGHAQQHGQSSDEGFFQQALNHLNQNQSQIQQDSSIDEGAAIQAHQRLYGDGNSGGGGQQQHDSSSLGMGAAMQALKLFTSSGGGPGQGGGLGGNVGGGQNQFIGMAMAQAGRLFDQQSAQGNVSGSASKESAIQQAGETALKMYMQSQMGGAGAAGSAGGGGLSGLMGLASKFL